MKKEVNLVPIIGVALLVILLIVAALTLTRCGGEPQPTEPTEESTQPTETEEPTEPPHVHEYEEVVTASDCISGGYTTFVCACGDSHIGDETDALGHAWADATCTEPKTCTVCGVTEGRANGHTWDDGKVTKEPKEELDGEMYYTCTVCGATTIKIIPGLKHEHKYTQEVIAPTCTEDGYTLYTCSCGDSYKDSEVTAPGHTWKDATCTAPEVCTVCGTTKDPALGHDWINATCTTSKTCDRCGDTIGDPLGHKETIVKGYDATCTKDGLTDGIQCSVCKTCLEEQKVIPAKGHDWNDATCAEPKTCKTCGATDGDPLGHEWIDATCTAPKTCVTCGATEGTIPGHQFAAATCTVPKTCKRCDAIEGTALGHDWKDATCTEPKTCKRCTVTDGTALGHDWKDATCTEPKTCKRCTVTDGTALGHDWKDATCTEPKTCKRCGVTEGTALEHSYDNGVVTYPTETTQGYTTYTCTRCGHSYKDNYTDKVAYDAGTLVFSTDGVARLYGNFDEVLKTYTGWLTATYSWNDAPWHSDWRSIKKVIIEDGVAPTSMSHWFYFCSEMKSIVIPDSVTSIGSDAFMGCSSLTSIVIPNSVTRIDDSAFRNCSSLTSIVIPNSVTRIDSGAFMGCSSLTSIVIHNGVTSIGIGVFSGCSSLTSIVISNSVISIGEYVFLGCDSLTTIVVASDNPVYHSAGNCIIETESKTLTHGCKSSIIPSDGSVTCIGESAFYGCSSLTSIVIPNSVTSIDSEAFEECSSLTSIVIPANVVSIASSAFDKASMKSVTVDSGNAVYHSSGNCIIETASKILIHGFSNSVIPSDGSVTSIGSYAFGNCDEITSIVIPESVTNIYYRSFTGCRNLTSVVISENVTFIGAFAFVDCSSLNNITFKGTVVQWNAIKQGGDSFLRVPATKVVCSDGTVSIVG